MKNRWLSTRLSWNLNNLMIGNFISYVLRKFDKRPVSLTLFLKAPESYSLNTLDDASLPKVSIIIPTRDKPELLSNCVDSIRRNTQYPDLEILIVNNSSIEPATLSLLERYRSEGIRVLDFTQAFNYSEICNLAATESTGEYLCFLNNDTEVIANNWLSSMVTHANQKDSGLVGALLTYPDGPVQHMGIALGYTGIAGHPNRGENPQACVPKECYQVSGVTFACAMIAKSKYWQLGGLDPKFPVGFNDVDLSIRSSKAGWKNTLCVDAKLVHAESQTRQRTQTLAGAFQALKDVLAILKKHPDELREPFFSPRD